MRRQWGYSFILIPFLGFGMSFNDVSEQAYRVSDEIIQSQGRVKSIGFEKTSFLSSEPMNIETSARAIHAEDRADKGIEYSVMVDYTLKAPSVRTAQEHEFDVQKQGVFSDINIQKGVIQIGLKHDWLLYQLEQERIHILKEKRDFAHKAYTDGEKKFKAGRLSKMELLRLKSEYDATLQEVSSSLMEAEHAQHRLKETVMIQDEVVIDDMNLTFIRLEGLAERISEAPAIRSLDKRIEVIDAQIITLRHSTLESFTFGIGMTQEPTQNSVDFRFSVPLVLSSKNEHKMAALMSERSSLVHARDVVREKLQINIGGLIEHLREREERIGILGESEKQYEILFTMAQKGYEGGVIGQFEYLATKNDYYAARLRTLELKQNYINEMAAIEEKLGRIW